MCGNGVVDANEGEECDDGNANNADGCSNACVVDAAALCAGALPAQAVNIGDTSVSSVGIDGPCFGPDGPESIFTFTPPANGTLTTLMHSLGEMVIYVRTDCDNQATELSCADAEGPNGTEFLETFVQGGVPLFIFVDGHFGEFSPFALEVSFEQCGNNVVAGNEACDDGNNVDLDGCNATCTSNEVCGNGFLDVTRGEACDDGNNVSGDGCESNCSFICGANTGPELALLNAGDGHCYVGFDDFQTWDAAQAICVGFGGSLVVIGSQAENDFLAPFIGVDFWIGLNDQVTEGTFAWVNGEAVSFTDFDAGEPNNGGGNQNCVVVFEGGGWDDDQCGDFFRYACELP